VNEVKGDSLAVRTKYGSNLRAEKFIALHELTTSLVVCDVNIVNFLHKKKSRMVQVGVKSV